MSAITTSASMAYTHSLINNLSLLSGLVLRPSSSQLFDIDRTIRSLVNSGKVRLDDSSMRMLISGHPTLNGDPIFRRLRTMVSKLPR